MSKPRPNDYTLFVGCYTRPNEADPHGVPHDDSQVGEGIYVLSCSAEGEMKQVAAAVEAGPNPAYVCVHPSGNFLFACNEVAEYEKVNHCPDTGEPLLAGRRYYDAAKNKWVNIKHKEVTEGTGSIQAFAIDLAADPPLRWLNTAASYGQHPCMLAMNHAGNVLCTANYSGGSVCMHRVEGDGAMGPMISWKVHDGSGRDRIRQEAAHCHSVVFPPASAPTADKYALVCDLGTDKVHTYSFGGVKNALLCDDHTKDKVFDPTVGGALFEHEGVYRTDAASGPRHVAFHPDGACVYVVNELSSTIDHCSYDASNGPRQALTGFHVTQRLRGSGMGIQLWSMGSGYCGAPQWPLSVREQQDPQLHCRVSARRRRGAPRCGTL